MTDPAEDRQTVIETIVTAAVAADPDPHASYQKWADLLADAPESVHFLAVFRAALPEGTPGSAAS
ncbi:hypothetical protein ACWGDX_13380 [Streptomyces sp. NPDC055025]